MTLAPHCQRGQLLGGRVIVLSDLRQLRPRLDDPLLTDHAVSLRRWFHRPIQAVSPVRISRCSHRDINLTVTTNGPTSGPLLSGSPRSTMVFRSTMVWRGRYGRRFRPLPLAYDEISVPSRHRRRSHKLEPLGISSFNRDHHRSIIYRDRLFVSATLQ